MKYFGIIMALVYVGAGIAILVRSNENLPIPSHLTIPFGIILIAYGVFRGYAAYKKSS